MFQDNRARGQNQMRFLIGSMAAAIAFDLDGAALTVVVAGAQDDHGGAGIGEFRQVLETASEWNGGGRTSAADSNVYDTLIVGARR